MAVVAWLGRRFGGRLGPRETVYVWLEFDGVLRVVIGRCGYTRVQVDFRAGQLELRAGQVDFRAEQLDIRAGQVDFKAGQLEIRAGHIDFRAVQLEFRAGQLEFRAGQVESRAQRVDFRAEQLDFRAVLQRQQEGQQELVYPVQALEKQQEEQHKEQQTQQEHPQQHVSTLTAHGNAEDMETSSPSQSAVRVPSEQTLKRAPRLMDCVRLHVPDNSSCSSGSHHMVDGVVLGSADGGARLKVWQQCLMLPRASYLPRSCV